MKNSYLVLFLLILILFLLLEFSFFSIPFIFIFSILVLSFYRNEISFLFVLLAGLMVDSLRIENFGITPFFIFATFLIIYLYEKYFGSSDVMVITLITIIATFVYSYILSYSLSSVVLLLLIAGALFYIFQYLVKKGIL